MKKNPILHLSLLLVAFQLYTCFFSEVFADVPAPNKKYLFIEDTRAAKNQRRNRSNKILKSDQSDLTKASPIDIQAPQMEFLKDSKTIKANGGVVISKQSLQVQADQATYNTESKQADLDGNVQFFSADANLSANSAKINLDSKLGEFDTADFEMEEGGYQIKSAKAYKLSDINYKLCDSIFTTCYCQGEDQQGEDEWNISAKNSDITQEGYLFAEDAYLEFKRIPVFYTPLLILPVKRERASGLLQPDFGFSSKDGFQTKLPLFAVIDDSSDLLFTPFVASNTRAGMGMEYREIFSNKSRMAAKLIYSNETWRNGALRGTRTSDISDPTFDTDRLGGYYSQVWRNDPDAELPLSFIADLKYISDDLFLREIEDGKIGRDNSRHLTSNLVLRSNFNPNTFAELGIEYNNSIVSNDDFQFQRLPELSVGYLNSFRVFGENSYGLKLKTNTTATATDFVRREGFDGQRYEVIPKFSVPFHYQNYFNSEFSLGLRQTYYQLEDRAIPTTSDPNDNYDATNQRQLYTLGFKIGTGVERAFDLAEDSFLNQVSMLGHKGKFNQIQRVKHTIEPIVSYTYVPDVSQQENPFFDTFDRINERSLFLYGFKSSLFAKYAQTGDAFSLIKSERDFDHTSVVDDLDPNKDQISNFSKNFTQRKSRVSELVSLIVKQSYDYKEDNENNDPRRRAWSDVGSELEFYPSSYWSFAIDGNFDYQNHNFSNWGMATQVNDDRGDAIRGRFIFLENSISQVEGNVELALIDRLKLGYYAKFDQRETEFIESKIALRLVSACNCWNIDLGYTEKINPDKSAVGLTFNLFGLGSVRTGFGLQ